MYVLSVIEVNAYVRELFETDEILRDVWVEGEVSNFVRHSSGHCYFSLKGEGAVLRSVMWRSYAAQLSALPANGDSVLARGYVSFYDARGEVQLYANMLQPAGAGVLHAQIEELKQRLTAEGLFDESRKRSLPLFPRRIGIATAPQAAALQDMLNVLGRRFPLVDVVIAPCLVQGEQAPSSIVQALYALYARDVDVIIVARGGGSIEDLWAFNDEAVARAVFASPMPVVTGVGHETDVTIVDYVADLRAPTPSAAAELVTPDRAELSADLSAMRQRLEAAITADVDARQRDVRSFEDLLRRRSPSSRIIRDRQYLDDLLRRVHSRLAYTVELERARLSGLQARLQALSPHATLDRGYAVVRRDADGRIVTRSEQVSIGDLIHITLQSGQATARVVETHLQSSE